MNGYAPFFSVDFKPIFCSQVGGLDSSEWVDMLRFRQVAYTTYHYWSRKVKLERESMPIAPIVLKSAEPEKALPSLDAGSLPGVMLAFPNGVKAHFGQGSEGVLMEVLTKSMCDVLP